MSLSVPSGKVWHLAAVADLARPASGEVAETARRHDSWVTRDRMDELFRHCADVGLSVEWAGLGHRRGEYWRRGDVVILNRRLTVAQAASTLAHEIGHHCWGDTCSTPANERRAWEYGAAWLISPAEYRAAEQLVGVNPAALALELGVTRRLVEAWRDWWLKRGQFLPLADLDADDADDTDGGVVGGGLADEGAI
ncbi:MAG: hypothetical protein CMH83_19645 [Nocardioides sp.]|nr:hypothetical protein [Nocardioides sp.]